MSAYDETIVSITLDADASLAKYTGVPGMPGSANPNYGNQFTFVRITGPHTCGLSTAGGQKTVGVVQNKPQKVGTGATVAIRGVSNVIAGADIHAGDRLKPDASGHAVVAADGEGANAIAVDDFVNGSAGPALLGRF